MSYFNSITQFVQVDSKNSSTANLISGSTYTGTGSSTLNVNGIQVSLKTDQNCTVYIDQSPDNTNWDVYDSFHYNTIINNFSQTVQAVNSYYRVRVTNLSSMANTTYFRLQTALCPIVNPLPRSLDENGYLKVAPYELNDEFGFKGQYTPMRDQKVCEPFRLVGTSFANTIDTNFWSGSYSGSAASSTSSLSNGVWTVNAGTEIAVIDGAKVLGTTDFYANFSSGLTVVIATNAKCTIIYE